MIDASDVAEFAGRLNTASKLIDTIETDWARDWGQVTANEMRASAPRLTGRLAASIHQVEPGGISIGADYWRFVERGTAHMPPQPFIAPSVNRVAPRAATDALTRASRLITK